MAKSIETQAKSIEAAIEDALSQLGASYDEVDVDIIQEAGFLKKAKVRVTLKEREVEKVVVKPVERASEKPVAVKEEVKEKKSAEKRQEKAKPEKKKEEKEGKEKAEKKESVQVSGDMPAKFQKTLDFATKLVELLGSGAVVTHEITERSFNINVTAVTAASGAEGHGGGVGQIIGKGGEVMNAIQTLVSSIAIANSAGENKRVYFNVEDYKERRTETLKALAVRKAEKVKETGRFIKLEPMNSRERAIIHSALQDIEGIRSYSTGKDPHRCLCIAPARKED